eukprot:1291172-Pleurochrysis_carterae.AAC.1
MALVEHGCNVNVKDRCAPKEGVAHRASAETPVRACICYRESASSYAYFLQTVRFECMHRAAGTRARQLLHAQMYPLSHVYIVTCICVCGGTRTRVT